MPSKSDLNRRQLRVPGDTLVHVAMHPKGSSHYNYNQTACLLEAQDSDTGFERTAEFPTCPFCIRDGNFPEELRSVYAHRAGLPGIPTREETP